MSTAVQVSRRSKPRSGTSSSTEETEPNSNIPKQIWKVWAAAFASSLVLWLAFPPIGWSLLSWVAPLGWLWLADSVESTKRPLAAAYVSGFFYWLLTTVWVCLPHQAACLGWIALAGYLAVYALAFVGFTRLAVRRCRLPLIVAAPTIWVGLEYLRGFLLSGFGIALLGHTQTYHPMLIQISDLGGAYAVSFLVMTVSSGIYLVAKRLVVPKEVCLSNSWIISGIYALVVVCFTLGYGYFRLAEATQKPGPRIAVIQANIPQSLKHGTANAQYIFNQYHNLTLSVLDENPDVIAWPETMYRFPVVWSDELTPSKQERLAETTAPEQLPLNEFRMRQSLLPLRELAQFYKTPFLVGLEIGIPQSEKQFDRYNAAALVEPTKGNITGIYKKAHPVMFGEYVPFAKQFPQLYQLFPLPGGIEAGPIYQKTLTVDEWKLSPTICYESTVAHLVREQVAWNRSQGHTPDVMLNLSNDGWFRGTSALDFHLMCGVFRAVECRKPFLAAANTGLSVHVDSNGIVKWQGPRQANAAHVAQVSVDHRTSGYLLFGDWFAGGCLLLTGVVLVGSRWRSAQEVQQQADDK